MSNHNTSPLIYYRRTWAAKLLRLADSVGNARQNQPMPVVPPFLRGWFRQTTKILNIANLCVKANK